LLKSLKKMKVPVLLWDGDIGEAAGRASDDVLANSDIIIDGIAGTGLQSPLNKAALEMVKAVNSHRRNRRLASQPFIVSVDMPSGNSDNWEPGMPITEADLTLAIEPLKCCIYNPAARPYAGIILPVRGILPRGIIARYEGIELLNWKSAHKKISKIRPDVYKNERGTVEIRSGSPGATGAAMISAQGAQAAGAGLIRLVADDDIYPMLASRAGGIMVIPAGNPPSVDFKADAILLGPGWGQAHDRALILEKALAFEQNGIPLVLDADAIVLARNMVFHGNAILTPHPGEFSKYTGIEKEKLLCRPGPVLLKYARERKAVILFKGHVITIAAPDGRLGVVDGMTPALAAGGSGDLLSGFCVAIAARMAKEGQPFDGYTCAAAAAALLIASGSSHRFKARFVDPLELAGKASRLAGKAWLSPDTHEGRRL
jgi:NAD(P)H-hydrate epimerase